MTITLTAAPWKFQDLVLKCQFSVGHIAYSKYAVNRSGQYEGKSPWKSGDPNLVRELGVYFSHRQSRNRGMPVFVPECLSLHLLASGLSEQHSLSISGASLEQLRNGASGSIFG